MERSRIYETVHRSGLASLTSCSHRVASRPMLSAFCERWQPETTTFHMPFGEMTITLDDVASILHIPVTGSMISFSQPLHVDDANALLVELLGTTDVEASRETEQCRSPSVRLLWLRDHFSTITDASFDDDVVFATRAFLLHLVGCTLFADKSATSVAVVYLELFRDLSMVGSYAWGAACLAYLYRQLTQAQERVYQSIWPGMSAYRIASSHLHSLDQVLRQMHDPLCPHMLHLRVIL